jgi:hypothetical protein
VTAPTIEMHVLKDGRQEGGTILANERARCEQHAIEIDRGLILLSELL